MMMNYGKHELSRARETIETSMELCKSSSIVSESGGGRFLFIMLLPIELSSMSITWLSRLRHGSTIDSIKSVKLHYQSTLLDEISVCSYLVVDISIFHF